MVKYPEIEVSLVGQDGNAFSILARCSDALKRHGHKDAVPAFMAEATSGDYGHLLRTVMAWVSVELSHNDCDCNGSDYEDEEEEECEDCGWAWYDCEC